MPKKKETKMKTITNQTENVFSFPLLGEVEVDVEKPKVVDGVVVNEVVKEKRTRVVDQLTLMPTFSIRERGIIEVDEATLVKLRTNDVFKALEDAEDIEIS